MSILAGVDIGGTKCAVCVGKSSADQIKIVGKRRFATLPTPQDTLAEILAQLSGLLDEYFLQPELKAIGVSCGGPLDSARGWVLSPPNLPKWDQVDVLSPLRARFGVSAGLQNDANAGALAEWKWGAGRGCRNMIFLTFGTGIGAGLILNGQLYSGTNDLAGEVGHIRMQPGGPVGYGKPGSLEGFCSGGGIARLAQALALEQIQLGQAPLFCPNLHDLPEISAEMVSQAARQADPLALRIFDITARELGRGLALLVDLLNPERIVIGSIYTRQRELLEPLVRRVLAEEALPQSLAVCQILPSALGESIGDLASLSVALNTMG